MGVAFLLTLGLLGVSRVQGRAFYRDEVRTMFPYSLPATKK